MINDHAALTVAPTQRARKRPYWEPTRALAWLVWALIATSVVPGALAMLVNGRPEALGEAVADHASTAIRVLGMLPVAAIAVVAATVLVRARQLRLTAVAGLHAGIVGWALATTALNGNLAAIGLSTIVAAIGGVVATFLAPDARVSAPRLVIVPFGLICTASLAMLVVLPDLAAYDVSRTSFSPLAGRLAGVLDHPNQLGTISGLLLALVIAVRPRFGWLWGLAAAACLFLSESRTAWAATLMVAGILIVARAINRGVRQLVIGAAALALLLVASVPFWVNLDRFMVALSERPAVWDFVIPKIAEAPIIGHGSGALPTFRDTEGLFLVRVGHGHNLLVQELFAGGIVGLVLMLALICLALSRGVTALGEGRGAGLALALFAAVSAPFDLVVSGLVSTQSTMVLTLLCVTATLARNPAAGAYAGSARGADRTQRRDPGPRASLAPAPQRPDGTA